jgi:adenylate kinase family enzyme
MTERPAAYRYARIAILGGAGAGKSTFARRLAEGLGLGVVHLDRLVFGPRWARRPKSDVRRDLTEALRDDHWVVEGTYPEVFDLVLPRSDLIIWLEQPVWLRLIRSWRKTRIHAGRPRADRPDGCEEGFDFSYATTIVQFGRWTKDIQQGLASIAPDASIMHLRGDAAAERFVKDVAGRRVALRRESTPGHDGSKC